MEKRARKSSGHLSAAQKAKLLDLVREKPTLRNGKFTKDFTLKDGQQEWENIANILNAIPGSNKGWRLWRKTWQDLQSKAKSKKADFNKSFRKTGGGPAPDPINDFDEGVLALINSNSVVGHEGVSESLVEFISEEENFVDVPLILPPPPEFDIQVIEISQNPDNQEQNKEPAEQEADKNEQNKVPAEQGADKTCKTNCAKKKINMKTLLKEKVELKRKLVESTIQFQLEYIRLQEQRNEILKDILTKFSKGNNDSNDS